MDCNKQPVATNNEKASRKMSSNAGQVDENGRERGKAAEEIDQRAKAQGSEKDEENIDDGSALNQIEPKRKNWKRQA